MIKNAFSIEKLDSSVITCKLSLLEFTRTKFCHSFEEVTFLMPSKQLAFELYSPSGNHKPAPPIFI